jgi:hypothetical protein
MQIKNHNTTHLENEDLDDLEVDEIEVLISDEAVLEDLILVM